MTERSHGHRRRQIYHDYQKVERRRKKFTFFYDRDVREALAPFGFDSIVVKFSTRPEKRVGSDEIWDKAEAALAEATKLAGLDYILNPGEGAFYGPKSVQNECRRKMLAFFYDRVQPRTPSASSLNSP